MFATFIPSPSNGVWHLGPLPIRAYALGIIIGALVAIWIGEKRFVAKGGRPGVISDVSMWAIPFGIVGARLYHVATDPELYFAEGKNPINAFKIWEGGLGIWGAVALGAVGAYIGCRRYNVKFPDVAGALAPGILVAQGIGRWGNYFNQELFGRPTTKPWGLEIDAAHRPSGYEQYATFHPTFLYESIWNIAGALVIIWLGNRLRLTGGRVFALYIMVYTTGRFWIEHLRIDFAHHFLGLRLNDWTSIILFILATAYFIHARPRSSAPEAESVTTGE